MDFLDGSLFSGEQHGEGGGVGSFRDRWNRPGASGMKVSPHLGHGIPSRPVGFVTFPEFEM